MQIKNLLIFIFSVNIFFSPAQNKKNSSADSKIYENFNEFLKYFDKKKINDKSNNTRIPVSVFECVIGNQCMVEYGKQQSKLTIQPLQLLNKNYYVTLIYKIIDATGSLKSDYHLATLTDEGILKKSKNIGTNNTVVKLKDSCKINYYNDKLLEVIKWLIIKNDNKEMIRKIEYNYYTIDKNGFASFFPEYSLGRKFPVISTKIMNSKELELYTLEQLELMKNEIFAEYGYIFTEIKWKQYFNKQKWYNPVTNNIDDLLTDIEKINIERIEQIIN